MHDYHKPSFEPLSSRLLLTATVSQIDRDVMIVGDPAAADEMILALNGDDYRLGINGLQLQTFNPDDIDRIMFENMDEADSLWITATAEDDRLRLFGDVFELKSPGVFVSGSNFGVVRLNGYRGNDTVRIIDSPGPDELYMHAEFSSYVNSNGSVLKMSAFEQIDARATKGGRDEVKFYDTPNDDRFVSKSGSLIDEVKDGFAYMVGDGFHNVARGFERIDAFSSAGGNDEARLYGTPFSDRLEAEPRRVVLSARTTSHIPAHVVSVAHNFPVTRSYGEGSNDLAELRGHEFGKDRFVWEPDSAYLQSTGKIVPNIDGEISLDATSNIAQFPPATNVAVGFRRVTAYGTDSADIAELRAADQLGQFIGFPEIAQMSAPDSFGSAIGFRIARGIGNLGSSAYLEGSDFNDTYISNDRFGYLEGPKYLNYVSRFASVNVNGAGPGFDDSNPQQYRGPNQDYLLFDGIQYLIVGPNRRERISGFDRGRGDGVNAGWGVLEPLTMPEPFTLGGSHDQNDLPSEEEVVEIRLWAGTPFIEYERVDDGRFLAQPEPDIGRPPGFAISRNFSVR